MTDQQRQDIINEIRDQTYELGKILRQPDKHYGFYQLCPKCDGEKIIPGTHYDNGTVLVDRTCPLCKGEGKLVRPEIKTT